MVENPVSAEPPKAVHISKGESAAAVGSPLLVFLGLFVPPPWNALPIATGIAVGITGLVETAGREHREKHGRGPIDDILDNI